MAYRIKFDRSKCVGCYACHMACLDAHYKAEEENAVSFRTTVKFIDREKDFEKNICPGCIHCGKCMFHSGKSRIVYRMQNMRICLPDSCHYIW